MDAFSVWFLDVFLWQTIGAICIGIFIGLTARATLKLSCHNNLIDQDSFLVFSLALSTCITSLVDLIGSNDFMALFFAGTVFGWDDWFTDILSSSNLQEVVELLFNSLYFIFYGSILPWKDISNQLLPINLLALLIILFRRLPAFVALYPFVPAFECIREALFAGWFGPIGVGAIFYTSLIQEFYISNLMNADFITEHLRPIVTFIVFFSIICHGITVPLLYFTVKTSNVEPIISIE